MSRRGNICMQIRAKSNEHRHAPNLSTENETFDETVELLIKLLEDPKYLNSKSQNTVKLLQELKTDTYEINPKRICQVLTDEIKVREELAQRSITESSEVAQIGIAESSEVAQRGITETSEAAQKGIAESSEAAQNDITESSEAAQKDITESLEAAQKGITESSEEAQKGITESSEAAQKDITESSEAAQKGTIVAVLECEKRTLMLLHDLYERLHEESKTVNSQALCEMIDLKAIAFYEISECAIEQMTSIRRTASKEQRKLQRKAKQLRDSLEKSDSESKDEDQNHGYQAGSTDTKSYEQFLEELQSHLIDFYQEEHQYLPISPLVDRNKAPLLDFYVDPTLYFVDIERQPFRNEESRFTNPVNSYKDIFYKGKRRCRNIYVSSPAGSGKTCMSKLLALTWCQAWKSDESKDGDFNQENLKIMRDFKFLFFISLRNCRLKECDVDEIIINQLMTNFPGQFNINDGLQRLLQSEECLIVIDGLDEWSHPTKKRKRCPKFNSKIPHRKLRKKTTFLTTTRRWKFHTICEENVQIDQQIEIAGLEKHSSDALIGKVVKHLNSRSDKTKNQQDFEKMLDTKGITELVRFPWILMQLLCLWYDEKDPGESKCQIFSNIIELLFKKAAKRANFEEKYKNITHKKGKGSNRQLPSCFNNAPLCQKYRDLLFALGKLSYETLFGENFDNSLVFDKNVAKIYLSEEKLSMCLETGILLQSRGCDQLTTDELNYSFLHKTFQELYAALFISSKCDLPKNMVPKIMKKIKTIDEILRLDMFLVFLSGLSPNVMKTLSEEFVPLISEDEITKRYRRNIGTIFIKDKVKIHDLSDLMVSCVEESENNRQDPAIIYLQDIFIDRRCIDAKFRSATARLVDTNRENAKSLYIHVHQTVPSNEIDTIMENVGVDSMKSLDKIFVWGNIGRVYVESLLKRSSSLNCLELWNQTLWPEYFYAMAAMENVSGLSLMSISISHDQINNLMSFISRDRVLTQLNLNKVVCSDHENQCPGYRLYLNADARPKLLLIDKLYVTDVDVNASCMQMCVVELLNKQGALVSVLRCLGNAPKLRRFECDAPVDDKDTDCLVSMVPKFVTLNYFRLKNIKLSGEGLGLSNMKNLMRVHLWHASLTSDIFKSIVRDVEASENSVIVILDNYTVEPETEAETTKEYVRTSPKFKVILDTAGKYPQFHFKTVLSRETI